MDIRRARWLLIDCVVVAALAGCGGDESDSPGPQTVQSVRLPCVGRNVFTGFPVNVYEISDSFLNSAVAYANWDAYGNPYIAYGPRYYQLQSSLLRQFMQLHECAHHQSAGGDEIMANCMALVTLRRNALSANQESAIAQWHITYDSIYGPIGAQYGGSGAAFWQLTLQCAGPRGVG